MIKLNAAAIPETLVESELFGHEAGAFTGATRRRAGRFELANGGTLFLDEIASTSLSVQERLLRVVEYGTFERLGSGTAVVVDVRLVGATNVDLPSEADAGRFRHDLLDRLAFDVLTVPPLRFRSDDVPLLALHFGRNMASELGWDRFPGFSKTAMSELGAYPWPGNVRELKNVVERAVYRTGGTGARTVSAVQFDPFASPYRPGVDTAVTDSNEHEALSKALTDSGGFQDTVANFEHWLLRRALERNQHNQRATAAELGLSYDQLRNKLRKRGLLPRMRSPGVDA
jgi:psp operon transcriptional activator